MKIIVCILLIVLTPLMTVIAEPSSLVLDPAILNVAPMQKFSADNFAADLGFRMAGIEVESIQLEDNTYQSITPLAPDPELFGDTGEEGMPELPIYAHMVGIPDRSGVSLEVLSASYEILDGYDIKPVQTPAVEGSSEILPFVKNEKFYRTDAFYPADVVRLGEPGIFRDLRMIQIIISPVQYNPVTKQLRVYTSIDYNLVYEGIDDRNVKIRRSNKIAESYLPLYRAIVPNADELLAGYEPVRGGYLIITPDAFADTIAVLGRWKHLKGYDVVIATASEVDPDGSSPNMYDVKNYIQNAYDNWDVPPEYVCIVGDKDGTYYIPDYPYSGYASDHPYSLVDGNDIHSDIMVSRMSVRSLAELRVAMIKALKFDREPYMGDLNYYLRALSSAGNVGSVTPRLTVLWVRQKLLEIGYNRVDTVFGWYSGAPGADSITASLNRGVSIISYRGWGFSDQWGSPLYYSSEIDGLTHGWKIGICLAITCGIGNFAVNECWGEKWIRAGSVTVPKGGPAFFGSTDWSTHTKWNNPIMVGYYWSLFREGIYNFGLAAARGKLDLFNSFPNQYSHVEKYHHTYNTLGEPELDIRTAIPRALTVTYPSTIPVGTNMLQVHVTVDGGTPLENAYVNLLKGRGVNEEVFVGGRTDANGDITLDFNTTVADTMFVTVTGRNCYPHLGFTLVQNQPVAVGISTTVIDDDNTGNSSGNNDGGINPDESIEFAITLKNYGNSTTATNVQATLTSSSPWVSITVPNQSYGNIGPGNTANSGKFAASFANNIPNGEHIILQLQITSDQGSWSAAVPADIKSIYFIHLSSSYPGNSNNRLDPGETSSFVVTLQNIGDLAGTSLVGVLSTSDPEISIVDGTADFGNIGVGGQGSNSASPFVITAAVDVFNGHNVNFNLEMTSSNGSVTSRGISLVVGTVNTFDPVGPDNYGYYMYDDMDSGYQPAPIYQWTEISPYSGGLGTRVNFPNNTDDDASVVSLPFNFNYYGRSFNYVLVCINGFVAFDTSKYDMGGNRWAPSHNMPIPEFGAPFGLIGPFWDDLQYSGNNGVFKYYDSANNRYIIEWKGCIHATTSSPETFQIIIYDPDHYPTPTGDSEILFQYQVVNNNDIDSGEEPGLYSTVGFQNLENNGGLQYTFDNMYHPGATVLAAGRAIKITTAGGTTPPPDIEYSPTSILASAGVGETTAETLHISNAGVGTLVFSLSEVADDRRLRQNRSIPDSQLQSPIGYMRNTSDKNPGVVEPIYPPIVADFGGPDAFGHEWIDSDEPGGPVYSWVDISGVGTEVFPGEDGSVGPVDIGFNFPFYENSYSGLFINSNGNLTFTSGSNVWLKGPIPTPGDPDNMIAAYWDDLSPQLGGHIFYYRDIANNRFIVSYNNAPIYGDGGSLNFEAILYPSGQIIMQYSSLDPGSGSLYSSTIGIENDSGTDGLQIAYNSVYIHQYMAIRISVPVVWMYSDIHGGVLESGESVFPVITFDATELGEGEYTGAIEITCNDPTESFVSIPARFIVGGTPPCDYIIGDFNGSLSFNVADIIAAFSKLQTGLPEPAYLCECPPGGGVEWAVAMDVNNSCIFNVADVIIGFSKLTTGSPDLIPCELCPPGGRSPRGDGRPLITPDLKSRIKLEKGY